MEHTSNISSVEPENISFDAVEVAGLIAPLLFAVMTIVLVALNPDPSGTVSKDSKIPPDRIEQIHRR